MSDNQRIISVANRHPRLRLNRRAVEQAVRRLDAEFSVPTRGTRSRWRTCPPGELSLVFVTDDELARLHAQFLDDPSITDVITFEGDLTLGTAGEVCVSADAARRQTAGARSPAAFAAELTLYVVHGWLHLAGYDDLQPARKRVMRRAEARAMALLQRHDAIPTFALR